MSERPMYGMVGRDFFALLHLPKISTLPSLLPSLPAFSLRRSGKMETHMKPNLLSAVLEACLQLLRLPRSYFPMHFGDTQTLYHAHLQMDVTLAMNGVVCLLQGEVAVWGAADIAVWGAGGVSSS